MRIIRKLLAKLNWSKKRYFAFIALIFFVTYIISAFYQVYKPLPEGLAYQGQATASEVEFLSDISYINADGKHQRQQHIFDAVLNMINEAQSTIVLDMFLFNAETANATVKHRPLTQEITEALLEKKRANPMMEIKLITDPINTMYGAIDAPHLHQLNKAGIEVITSDLTTLRASNPTWTGFWYMCCQGLGNNLQGGWINNPLSGEKITLRSYLNFINFKANHRKVLVVDSIEGWKALISSANIHDASSAYSNVAVVVKAKVATEVLNTERTVAKLSQGDVPVVIMGNLPTQAELPTVQLLTEGAIHHEILAAIDVLKAGDRLDLMMLYLSERKIIDAMLAAKQRGVQLRVLLDPNNNVLGHQHQGIPNRPVASELNDAGILVRWCNPQAEQCQSKMLISSVKGQQQMIIGSANYTARDLKNYNLNTNLSIKGTATYPALAQAQTYFDRAWANQNGEKMSVDYAVLKDESTFSYGVYRFIEWSGLMRF